MPSNFWYLLKSCGFIQNRHVIIESKETPKVQYSPSFRNNQFSLSCCVDFLSKMKHFKKFGKSGFSKSYFPKNLNPSKK